MIHQPPFSAVTRYFAPLRVPRMQTRPLSSAFTKVVSMWEYSHLPGPLSTAFHEIGFCLLVGRRCPAAGGAAAPPYRFWLRGSTALPRFGLILRLRGSTALPIYGRAALLRRRV